MTLLELADFAQRVGNIPTKFGDEAENLLLEVTAQFEALAGRVFNTVAGRVWTSRPNFRSNVIWIPTTPVTTITLVESRSLHRTGWCTLETSDYELIDAEQGELQRLVSFWQDRVRVTYDGGYTSTTCPTDIQGAIVTQARFLQVRRRADLIGLKAKGLQGGSSDFMERADYHPVFRQVAKQHRRIAL